LHNIAVTIRSSTILSDAWLSLAGISLGIDNQTRWNSWFQLLKKAINNRAALSQFIFTNKAFEDDRLTDNDWEILEVSKRFLEPFYKATLAAESDTSSLELVIFNIENLLGLYEKYQAKYSQNEHLSRSLEMGWYVLREYYSLTDDTPVYCMAILLHPAMRMQYINNRWEQHWWETIRPQVEALWIEYSDLKLGPTEKEPEIALEDDDFIDFARPSITLLEHRSGDEFERFINSGICGISIPVLEWWSLDEQRKRFPRLSRLARDIYSIPPMSDEPERIFSSARRVISWDRTRLGDSTFENLSCLKHWVNNGHCSSLIPQDIELEDLGEGEEDVDSE